MSFETLMGKLMTHKLDLNDFEESTHKEKNKALRTHHKRAFDDTSEDDDLAQIFRKFMKFLQYKKSYHKTKKEFKESICYNCRRPGHIQKNCPKVKKANCYERSNKERSSSRKYANTSIWYERETSD